MAEAKAGTKRIYRVKTGTEGADRLIKASNAQQAVSFAARGQFKAAVASQDDLLQLVGKVEVETAGDTPELVAT